MEGKMDVYDAIHMRNTITKFTEQKVTDHDLIVLIKAGEKACSRISPLRIFSVQNSMLIHEMYSTAFDQEVVKESSTLIIIATDFAKYVLKYGDYGRKYVYMEAGHAAQNIRLMAISLGLGSVTISAFKDTKVRSILRMDVDPLYIIPVGYTVKYAPKGVIYETRAVHAV